MYTQETTIVQLNSDLIQPLQRSWEIQKVDPEALKSERAGSFHYTHQNYLPTPSHNNFQHNFYFHNLQLSDNMLPLTNLRRVHQLETGNESHESF